MANIFPSGLLLLCNTPFAWCPSFEPCFWATGAGCPSLSPAFGEGWEQTSDWISRRAVVPRTLMRQNVRGA